MDYHAQAKEDGPVTMEVRGVTMGGGVSLWRSGVSL